MRCPLYRIVSVPQLTVCTIGSKNVLVFLKLYLTLLFKKISSIKLGFKSFIVLNISVICNYTFFWCIVTDLSFSNKDSKLEAYSLYAIRKALSCSLLILLFIFLLRNIHTKGQYWNWLVTNALINSLNLSVPRYVDMRDKANSLFPTFLQILLTCFSKLRFESIQTLKVSLLVNY